MLTIQQLKFSYGCYALLEPNCLYFFSNFVKDEKTDRSLYLHVRKHWVSGPRNCTNNGTSAQFMFRFPNLLGKSEAERDLCEIKLKVIRAFFLREIIISRYWLAKIVWKESNFWWTWRSSALEKKRCSNCRIISELKNLLYQNRAGTTLETKVQFLLFFPLCVSFLFLISILILFFLNQNNFFMIFFLLSIALVSWKRCS